MEWLSRHDSGIGQIIRGISCAAALRRFPPGIGRVLVNHYCTAHGASLELTRDLMTEMEADVDLNWTRHPRFNANFQHIAVSFVDELVQEMRRSDRTVAPSAVFAQRSRDVDFRGMSITRHHGGLGVFTIHYRGSLTITLYGDTDWRWGFDGQMQWSDRWDFEIRPAGSDNRAAEGQRQTWYGHNLLVGTPFSVSSPWVTVRQTSADRRAIWVGNDGTHEPRNIPLLPIF